MRRDASTPLISKVMNILLIQDISFYCTFRHHDRHAACCLQAC